MNYKTSIETASTPVHRIHKQENCYQAEVFLPGVPRENLEIRLEKNVLELNAKRTPTPPSWIPVQQEARPAKYHLGLRLGREVDTSRISAELKNGVLLLTLPLQSEPVPVTRAIEVN